MSRLPLISPESATGNVKQSFDLLQKKLGTVPNMTKAMANAPAVLDGYLQFSGALSKGQLSSKLREQIALAVSEANRCDYCLAAHSAIGKMLGLTPEQLNDSRSGTAVDPHDAKLLGLARLLVENRGQVEDKQLQELRDAGIGDAAIAEVVANVALNIFTNYFNHVAATEVDFPRVSSYEPTSAN